MDLLWAFTISIYIFVQHFLGTSPKPPGKEATTENFPYLLPQNLPLSCGVEWPRCPDWLSVDWDIASAACCKDKHPGRRLHCQESTRDASEESEKKMEVVVACLPSIVCSPGSVPVVMEEIRDNVTLAFVECQTCSSGSFDDSFHASHEFRQQRCQRTHQACDADLGKTVVTSGNASDDTRCGCHDGFTHFPRSALCGSLQGFDADSDCHCLRNMGKYEPGILAPDGLMHSGTQGETSLWFVGVIGLVLLGIGVLVYIVNVFITTRRNSRKKRYRSSIEE